MMNKKGAIVLRDIMFMLIIFAGIMAMASIFVFDMASEYENEGMTSDYNSLGASNLGGKLLGNVSNSVQTMRDKTESASESEDSLLGSFTSITGIIQGAATILKAVITAPIYIKNALTIMMDSIGVPTQLAFIIGNVIMLTIYSIIVFVIVSSLLKGGKV